MSDTRTDTGFKPFPNCCELCCVYQSNDSMFGFRMELGPGLPKLKPAAGSEDPDTKGEDPDTWICIDCAHTISKAERGC